MATTELTSSNLDTLIKDSNILAIDFWASWCGPCRMFGPTFEKASEKHTDAVFAKCNTEEQQQVAATFGVRSIPTLAIFREGIMVFMQPGALPPAALEDVLTKVKALDMDDVRNKLAEEEAKLAKSKGSAQATA